MGGYQSHYTVVGDAKDKDNKETYFPSKKVTDTSPDELVVFQDAQAHAKFIVKVKDPSAEGDEDEDEDEDEGGDDDEDQADDEEDEEDE